MKVNTIAQLLAAASCVVTTTTAAAQTLQGFAGFGRGGC